MNRAKISLLAAAAVVVLLAAGGTWWWQAHRSGGRPAAAKAEPASNQDTPSGGLTVGGGGAASNLGQLDTNPPGAAADNSPNPVLVDPSTFAQYDKYKDANGGLYAEIKPGDGAELTAGRQAALYYKGWLTSGQLFDQSRANADGSLQPFIFTLGAHGIIPGLEQGLAGMKAGGTRLVIVPPAYGYGAQGQGAIPPNAVLVFQVKLLQVQ